MNRKKLFLILGLFVASCAFVCAQKSSLHQRAEEESAKHNVAAARSNYIHAFNDYVAKGQLRPGVECAVKATALYYTENFYQEAFDLLRRADQTIIGSNQDAKAKAAMFYLTSKERFQMYMKMRRGASAMDHLNAMERRANEANDEDLKNDLLYNKTIYFYTFGQTAQGDAVFKQMAAKLTAKKEYDKVDEAYQSLIASGRRSNNASLVAQSYKSYIVWKDSVDALKVADEIGALKQQIADGEATIAEKDSSLGSRQAIIIGLCVVVVALIAALVVGGIVLLRFILLTRKQKKTIHLANESNALKAKFISNISAQLEPTLRKLDARLPEVKALLDFSDHIQTLSDLENTAEEEVTLEDTQLQPFCEELINQFNDKVKKDVELILNVPKTEVPINKEYVSHILLHLLSNAAEFTPEGGHIRLEYKKRGVHKHQFLVSNTGEVIPEEKREDVFKPFVEIRDLTTGDGLGLPTCKQMALKMKGDLEIDEQFTKGTRFVLDLYA
jgi:signal transduction histidine kinase